MKVLSSYLSMLSLFRTPYWTVPPTGAFSKSAWSHVVVQYQFNQRTSLMRNALLALLTTSLVALPISAQTNACDLNQDSSVNNVDVQLSVNMSLGITPCTANIYGVGVCNAIVVQRVVNAALGGSCITGSGSSIPRSVSLNWTASTTPNVNYQVYRSTLPSGPYTKVTSSPITTTSYTDTTVQSGQTYYYVATAVNTSNLESTYSNQATANVP